MEKVPYFLKVCTRPCYRGSRTRKLQLLSSHLHMETSTNEDLFESLTENVSKAWAGINKGSMAQNSKDFSVPYLASESAKKHDQIGFGISKATVLALPICMHYERYFRKYECHNLFMNLKF